MHFFLVAIRFSSSPNSHLCSLGLGPVCFSFWKLQLCSSYLHTEKTGLTLAFLRPTVPPTGGPKRFPVGFFSFPSPLRESAGFRSSCVLTFFFWALFSLYSIELPFFGWAVPQGFYLGFSSPSVATGFFVVEELLWRPRRPLCLFSGDVRLVGELFGLSFFFFSCECFFAMPPSLPVARALDPLVSVSISLRGQA